MKALVVEKPGQASVQDVPLPLPARGEVRVRVMAAGLCGSDAHIYHGTYPAQYPLIQGHEFSGVIDALGEGVEGWREGQRVTADPNIYCHRCYYCLRDQKNMCENAQASGVTRDGGFAEFLNVPVTQLYELPPEVGYDAGAMVEPLACAIYGMNRLELPFGSRALILGAGPMGLLLLQALRLGGACLVAVVDTVPARLDKAKALGADRVYSDAEQSKEEYPRGFDAVVDATGNPHVIETMFRYAAKRAKILQFGCAPTDARVSVSPYAIYDNDWTYLGTRTAVYTFGQAIDMLASGRIDARALISETVTLEKLGYYLEKGKPADAFKILVKPSGDV